MNTSNYYRTPRYYMFGYQGPNYPGVWRNELPAPASQSAQARTLGQDSGGVKLGHVAILALLGLGAYMMLKKPRRRANPRRRRRRNPRRREDVVRRIKKLRALAGDRQTPEERAAWDRAQEMKERYDVKGRELR